MPYRHRSRSKPSSLSYLQIDVEIGGSSTVAGPYTTAWENETMQDVVTPSFRKIVKEGGTIISPCTYHRSRRQSSGTGRVTYQSVDGSGNIDYLATASGPVTGRALQAMGTKPYAELHSAPIAWDAQLKAIANIDTSATERGEDIAELRKTIQFLVSPLKSILKEMDRIDRTKIRRIRRGWVAERDAVIKGSRIRQASASWLTYQFALSPLLRSVHEVLSEIQYPTDRPPEIRVAHGRSKTSDKVSYLVPLGDLSARTNMSVSSRSELAYHASIRYKHSVSSSDFRWRYGLRNKDILPTFWAVVPLSFMVDRIFDVSAMIKATQNLLDPSIEILGSSLVYKLDQSISYRAESFSTNIPSATYNGSGETITDTSFVYDRTRFSPAAIHLVPPLKLANSVNSLSKVADLAALIIQRLPRK